MRRESSITVRSHRGRWEAAQLPGVFPVVSPLRRLVDLGYSDGKQSRRRRGRQSGCTGQGIEAAKLDRCEKQRLAELLWQEVDQCLARAERLSLAQAAPTDQEG